MRDDKPPTKQTVHPTKSGERDGEKSKREQKSTIPTDIVSGTRFRKTRSYLLSIQIMFYFFLLVSFLSNTYTHTAVFWIWLSVFGVVLCNSCLKRQSCVTVTGCFSFHRSFFLLSSPNVNEYTAIHVGVYGYAFTDVACLSLTTTLNHLL